MARAAPNSFSGDPTVTKAVISDDYNPTHPDAEAWLKSTPIPGTDTESLLAEARKISESSQSPLPMPARLAVAMYTLQGGVQSEVFRCAQAGDEGRVAPLRDFVYHLQSALRGMPPTPQRLLFRGLPAGYGSGGRGVEWQHYTSATSDPLVAIKAAGPDGVVAAIMAVDTKPVVDLTGKPKDEEWIIAPTTLNIPVIEEGKDLSIMLGTVMQCEELKTRKTIMLEGNGAGKVVDFLLRDLAMDGRNAVKLNLLGWLKETWLGQREEAKAAYRQSMGADPANKDACRNLGTAFFMEGKIDEALQHWQEHLRLNPTDPLCLRNLGGTYLSQGKFEEASRYAQLLTQTHPGDGHGFTIWGRVLQENKDLEGAKEKLIQARDLMHEDDAAHGNVAQLCHWLLLKAENDKDRTKFRKEAEQNFTRALKLNPKNPVTLANFGALRLDCGNAEEALSLYTRAMDVANTPEEATEFKQRTATCHACLGLLAMREKGDVAAAKQHLENCLRTGQRCVESADLMRAIQEGPQQAMAEGRGARGMGRGRGGRR